MDTVTITLDLPQSVCAAIGVRESELTPVIREAVAVELYRTGQLSLGKAAEVAGVTRVEMMQVLAKHDVWLLYDVHDAASDWNTLKDMLSQ